MSRLSEAEKRLLKVDEGHALAESDLMKSKEGKGTTLSSPGWESARAASLEVALDELRSDHVATLATAESYLNQV